MGRLQPHGVNLDDSHVRVGIAAHQAGRVAFAVVQGYDDGFRAVYQVIVGQHVAVGLQDDAGAYADAGRCRIGIASARGNGKHMNDGGRQLTYHVNSGEFTVSSATQVSG